MQELKSFNEWMRHLGYAWMKGKEQFVKTEVTETEARAIIEEYRAYGVIEHG